LEPITVARKPLSEKTIAKNVLKWGTGGINIDECRVEIDKNDVNMRPNAKNHNKTKSNEIFGKRDASANVATSDAGYHDSKGRFPANLIHDGSDDVEKCFPITGGGGKPRTKTRKDGHVYGDIKHNVEYAPYSDTLGGGGSASRYFYCAKANKKDRNEGLDEKNTHPTVKPTNLMRYLVRLVTPPNGIVLDPFMGSGSTGKASIMEDFRFIGIEVEEEYVEIAKLRIEKHIL
jgi:site-specific DNA-methyltransferase (adenine-specific)